MTQPLSEPPRRHAEARHSSEVLRTPEWLRQGSVAMHARSSGADRSPLRRSPGERSTARHKSGLQARGATEPPAQIHASGLASPALLNTRVLASIQGKAV